MLLQGDSTYAALREREETSKTDAYAPIEDVTSAATKHKSVPLQGTLPIRHRCV